MNSWNYQSQIYRNPWETPRMPLEASAIVPSDLLVTAQRLTREAEENTNLMSHLALRCL